MINPESREYISISAEINAAGNITNYVLIQQYNATAHVLVGTYGNNLTAHICPLAMSMCLMSKTIGKRALQ